MTQKETESQPEEESSHPPSSDEDEPERTPAPESKLEESQMSLETHPQQQTIDKGISE